MTTINVPPANPGEVIEEYLEHYEISHGELSERLGVSLAKVSSLLAGESPITDELAAQLETLLQRPAHFWRNLDQRWRAR